MTLPAPHVPGLFHVELVCLGNICRSPTAHVVLEQRVADAGLGDRVRVTSSGTGEWHVGGAMDRRAAAALTDAGYDASRHRARQLDHAAVEPADLYLAMDAGNRADAVRRGLPPERVRLFRDADPAGPGDVPDPYGGSRSAFAEVLAIIERTVEVLVDDLRFAVEQPALRTP